MSKPTPGPWYATPWKHGLISICAVADDVVLGEICMPNSEDNARLIAAAPDLLKELETAVTWIEQIESYEIFDPSAPSKHELLPQLRAAIAKARGGGG